jgi:hypothetical protein
MIWEVFIVYALMLLADATLLFYVGVAVFLTGLGWALWLTRRLE